MHLFPVDFPRVNRNLEPSSVLPPTMADETQPEIPAPGKGTRARTPLIVAVVLLAIIAGFLLIPERPSAELVLLGPGGFAKATRPGVLTQLKYKLARIAGPLLNRFRRAKRQIVLKATFISLPASENPVQGLASLAGTNDAGVAVWVLSEPETRTLLRQLQTNIGATTLNQASIVTYDGGQATINNGINLRAGTSWAWSGMRLEVLPKISSHSIRLLMDATWSEEAVPGGGAASVRTNFSAGCSALLTNTAGLVLIGRNKREPGGTNLVLIISTSAVDSLGNRLNL